MFVTLMITLCALAISLYAQAWLAAREIRRHRSLRGAPPTARFMVLRGDPKDLGLRPPGPAG